MVNENRSEVECLMKIVNGRHCRDYRCARCTRTNKNFLLIHLMFRQSRLTISQCTGLIKIQHLLPDTLKYNFVFKIVFYEAFV